MALLRCWLASALTVGLLAAGSAAAEEKKFAWSQDDAAGVADLKYDGAPVLRYQYAYDPSTPERLHETYKVYHHVFGPGTGAVITKGPGGEYTHHRGLYLGWNKTGFDGQSADFWHCTNGAHQRHVKFLKLEGDGEGAKFGAEIHWNDKEGKPVIIEERWYDVHTEPMPAANAPPGWRIDLTSTLKSQRGPITLEGDRQHAGFQFRANNAVAVAKGARYIRPAAFPDKPEAIEVGDAGDPPAHINLGWFAMTYELDGRRYTVDYFESPEMPKPSLYSERPYGRFGAFFKSKLETDKPLTLRYRVIVSTGDAPSRDQIQQRYDQFVKDLAAKP